MFCICYKLAEVFFLSENRTLDKPFICINRSDNRVDKCRNKWKTCKNNSVFLMCQQCFDVSTTSVNLLKCYERKVNYYFSLGVMLKPNVPIHLQS